MTSGAETFATVGVTATAVVEPEVKKRRGRKPKETKVEVISSKVSIIDSLNVSSKPSTVIVDGDKDTTSNINNDASSSTTKTMDESNADDTKEPKKGRRGRKPKYVYSSFDVASNIDENQGTTNTTDDENVIVRLNISNDVLNIVSGSNVDEQPYAYNHDTYNNISNINDILSCQDDGTSNKKNKNDNNAKVVNVLNEFAEKNKNNEWPSNTSISCYWCVHRFDNAPFGIPINYKNGSFDVFGCFCSLECAAAHNFNENKSQDEMWERYQLINMMSREMKMGNIVRCSPPRLSLKVFGGNMDIDTFRNVGKSNKIMNVNFPPMTSITQQLEEINDFEISNDFKYIPVDDDRINKYKEKIIFKRNKPLIDKNKSLESSMNLKFSS
jgi:hypothetical protein